MIEEVIRKGLSWLGKFIVEELEKIEGKVSLIYEEEKTQTAHLKRLNSTLEKSLAHLESLDGCTIRSGAYLEDIKDSTFTARNILLDINNRQAGKGDDI